MRHRTHAPLLSPLLLLGLTACAGSGTIWSPAGADDDTTTAGSDTLVSAGGADAGTGTSSSGSKPSPVGRSKVFAHTSKQLFSVDPSTFKVTPVAPFSWPAGTDSMTDIALDKQGRMIGISYDKLYEVDPKTGACRLLSHLSRRFVGLSYVSDAGKEQLVGIDSSQGLVFSIDPKTGAHRPIGMLGGGWRASGDLVSVTGFGTVATVKPMGPSKTTTNDTLVRVDPKTGRAKPIGDIGFRNIWGLGFWKSQLYGFTGSSELLSIDIKTGRGRLVSRGGGAWWGAGVTTSAPVIK